MVWFAIDVRAHVQQHGGRTLGGGENLGDGRPIHAFERPQHNLGSGHHRARVAGADHSVRLAFMHQPRGDPDGGIAPLAKGFGGLIVHRDRFTGVDNLDGEAAGIALGKFLAETILRSHQQHLREPGACGLYGSLEFRLGCRVGAHGINCNASHGDQFKPWNLASAGRIDCTGVNLRTQTANSLRGFLHQDCFVPLVVTTMRADMVRHLRFVAVRALG